MRKIRIPAFLLLPGVLFLASCSIFPSPQVTTSQYYDLSIPERLPLAGISLHILPFASNSGERYKMALRDGNTIRSSEGSKWVLPPGSLLTKYFRLAFRSKGGSSVGKRSITLSGNVSAFESNNKEALLGLTYKLRSKNKEFFRTILIREKQENDTAQAFAASMSKAARKAAESIAQDIKKF